MKRWKTQYKSGKIFFQFKNIVFLHYMQLPTRYETCINQIWKFSYYNTSIFITALTLQVMDVAQLLHKSWFLYYFLQIIYGNNFHWCNFSFHNIPQIFYHIEIWLVTTLRTQYHHPETFFYICKQHEISTLLYKNNAVSYLNE